MEKEEKIMAKKDVEELLIKGGEDEPFRQKYNIAKDKAEFIALAKVDGYEFTEEELDAVLRSSGDSFASFGNPPKRAIWW